MRWLVVEILYISLHDSQCFKTNHITYHAWLHLEIHDPQCFKTNHITYNAWQHLEKRLLII
jgi:hypothetical protein